MTNRYNVKWREFHRILNSNQNWVENSIESSLAIPNLTDKIYSTVDHSNFTCEQKEAGRNKTPYRELKITKPRDSLNYAGISKREFAERESNSVEMIRPRNKLEFWWPPVTVHI